jgi:MFS family permease
VRPAWSRYPATDREPDRWAALILRSVAQAMLVVDATIVTIAIPSAQTALHFSAETRERFVTAYALAFASLLLLGGNLGNLFGEAGDDARHGLRATTGAEAPPQV